MATTDTCGGAPLDGVVAIPLGTGVSLTLIRSERGYCFSSWSRHDGRELPIIGDDHREQAFPTPEEAAEFFRQLLQTLMS
jgi:hypothetical protein